MDESLKLKDLYESLLFAIVMAGGKQLIQRRVNEVSFAKGFIIKIMQATLY